MEYYTRNAEAFVDATLQVDMQPLYDRFLPLLPQGAHILDAGCGSGRDAKHFLDCGYTVTAFDASPEIAKLAEQHIGQPVQVLRLQELPYQNQFDGIWACASLLHVRLKELSDVFRRLAEALRPSGVLYCSFKYGQGEYEKDGRRFSDLDQEGLNGVVAGVDGLAVEDVWVSADQRPGREHERWLNGVLVRVGS